MSDTVSAAHKKIKLSAVATINPKIAPEAQLTADTVVSFVPMAAVNELSGSIVRRETRQLADVSKGFTAFREGDVLLAKITPCMENGKVAVARKLVGGIGFGSTEFHVIRCGDQLSSGYILRLFQSPRFRKTAERNMTGSAGQKRVPTAFLADYKIPLPPLPIQQKIAAILDAADAMRQKDRALLERYDALLQSTFHQLFGDPVQNEKGWEVKPLSKLGKWKSGGTPSREMSNFFGGDISWVSSGELNDVYINGSKEKITLEGLNSSSASLIEPFSLLLGMYDTAALKSSINTIPLSCNQAIAFAKLDDSKCTTLFVYTYIQLAKEHLRRMQRGVRQKNLNLSMINDMPVLLPPLSFQNHFAEIAQSIQQQKAKVKAQAAKSEALFHSLLHRAFEGELLS